MYGIAGETNIMLWMWVGWIEGFISFIVKFLRMYVVDKAYKIDKNSTYSFADKTMAAAMREGAE